MLIFIKHKLRMTNLNKKNNQIQTSNFSKKMTEIEYENMLNESRKTRGYSLEQSKKYLNL
jgi:hypothetical protein